MEIPPYKSEESFKEKLLYAIRHCTAIDADIEGGVHNEEEHILAGEAPLGRSESRSSRSERRHDDDENENEEEGGMNEEEQYEDQEEEEVNDNGGGGEEE